MYVCICHLILGEHSQNLDTKSTDQAKPCHHNNILFARAFAEKTDNVVPLINLLELLNTEALAKITKTRKTLLALTRVVWSQA